MTRKHNPFDPADATLHDAQHIPSGRETSRNALVPGLRVRHDGWTEQRTQLFFDALGYTGCVRDACRIAGLSNVAAYRNRARFPEFARAWDAALERSQQGLIAIAYKRAVEGAEEIIIRKGEVHEIRKKPSDAMLCQLIRQNQAPRQDRDKIITLPEWENRWRFGDKGEKFQEADPAIIQKQFDDKLETMRARLIAAAEMNGTCVYCQQPMPGWTPNHSIASMTCIAAPETLQSLDDDD